MNTSPSFFRFLQSLYRILAARPAVPRGLKDNPVLQTLFQRRSVRRFSSQDIPDEVFAAILEAGRLAPSGVNLQSWTFLTFTPQTWEEVFGAAHLPFRARRAVMILADTHRARRVVQAYPDSPLVEYTFSVMNASLAAMNMNIAAEALGVCSVMLSETGRSGILDLAYLRQKLDLPDWVFPLMTIAFGYPSRGIPPMPPRLPLAGICFEGRYRETDEADLQEWVRQMEDGTRAGSPNVTIESKLAYYEPKTRQAEAELEASLLKGIRPPCE